MSDPSPNLLEELAKGLLTLGGGGVLGALLKGLIDGRAARETKATAEPADFLRAAVEFQDKLSEGGAELLEEFRKEFRFLRGQVDRLNGELEAAKAEVARTWIEIAGERENHAHCRRELTALRLELEDRLGQLPLTLPHEFR